jgi:hypothetical protein
MVQAVIGTLSKGRFDTYLSAVGYDQKRAISLYLWNAKLGASFHVPIQAVEVALRNRINHALVQEFGLNWWDAPDFLTLIDKERIKDLRLVKIRIKRQKLVVQTDQIVASLTFGFWVGMLAPKYNPRLWGNHLRTTFPYLPASKRRDEIFKLAANVARFRNRISHHEPLIRDDVSQRYNDIMTLISWLCPDTEKWIRPHCEVPKVMRTKP